MTSWMDGPWVAFDVESTGVDPTEARLVTAVVAKIHGSDVTARDWLINPGCEIPAEATAIHGITTEKALAEGKPTDQAVREIVLALVDAWRAGTPVIAFNAVYDLTVVDHELARTGQPPLSEWLGGSVGPVIDPFVIDKRVDRYRKGSRKLADQCATYNVKIDGAHQAHHDAIAAARVAWRIGQMYPMVGQASADELHDLQVTWFAEQARSFEDYLHSRGNYESVPTDWPVRPCEIRAAA